MLWSDEKIEHELRGLAAVRQRFPTIRELRAAGLGSLYEHLRSRGELDVWAARLGLKRHRARWTEHDIERALRDLTSGLQRFPTANEFRQAGLEGMYSALHARGELDSWARQLGLERRRRWTDAAIAAALGELCAGQQRFPSAQQFHAAGLSGLYSALYLRGELDSWAGRLGLPRQRPGDPRRWDDEAISHALQGLCAGRERFPTGREFREAGLYGLYAALRRRGELDAWAQRLALARSTHRYPSSRARREHA